MSDGDSSSQDNAIRGYLVAAVKATTEALDGVVDAPEVEALLAKRAPWLAQIEAARAAGEAWGEAEAGLVRQLLELDEQLVARMWGPRADAFAWLMNRSPEATDQLPLLTELARKHQAAVVAPEETSAEDAELEAAIGADRRERDR